MSVLETEGLTRRFGTLTAVDALTISVEAGEVFALLGANGAGKTVTMKMLTTLLRPSAGNARVAGFDIVHHAAEVRRVIGYVPQLVSADGALTGYENLLIFAKLYDIARVELLGAACFSTLSLIIAALVKTRERFMGIGQILTMPLFFASNAIYPVAIMPPWLRVCAQINPLTYEVDALRAMMLPAAPSVHGLGLDAGVLIAALTALVLVGARVYPRIAT